MNIEAAKNALTNLTGKVAIVTGGARGQGAVEVEMLAAAGAEVWICDLLTEEGDALQARLAARGFNTRFRELDVTDEDDWAHLVEETKNQSGRLDVLVNNAGIINRKPIKTISPEEWRCVLDVNLTGCFLGIQYCAELMSSSGGGSIINISSNSGFSGHYDAAYTASKWGIRGLTKSAAMEFAENNIRVNAICPGLIVTDLNRGSPHLEPMINMTPAARSGECEEVAQLVLFLASEASSFISGEDIVIDGGFTAGAAYRHVAKETGVL